MALATAPWEPWVRYVRLRATSPTYGEVTVIMVDEPGRIASICCVWRQTLSAPS